MKMYKLLGANGELYSSETPGTFGGNGKLKIYGRLDCPSALSTIRRFPVYSLRMKKQLLRRVIVRAETACGKSTVSIRIILRSIGKSLDCNMFSKNKNNPTNRDLTR